MKHHVPTYCGEWLREAVLKELGHNCVSVHGGHGVMPRFLVICGTNTFTLFCPAIDLQLVKKFLIYYEATGFVMSCDWQEPDAVASMAVTANKCLAGYRLFKGEPLSWSEVCWLDGDAVDAELKGLLPASGDRVSGEDVEWINAEMDACRLMKFGQGVDGARLV